MALYCLINMRRRKLRTCLTIFGVMIGIASLIAFLSIAIGYRRNVLKDFSGENAATVITVTSKKQGDVQEDDVKKLLTEERMEEFTEMSHIISVSPELEYQGSFRYGKYSGNVVLRGVEKSRIRKIRLEKGVLPEDSAASVPVALCENVKESMYYTEGSKVTTILSDGEKLEDGWYRQIQEISILDENALADMLEETESEEEKGANGRVVDKATVTKKGDRNRRGPEPKYKGYDPGFTEQDIAEEDKNDLYSGTEEEDTTSGYVSMSVEMSGIVDRKMAEELEYRGMAFADIDLLKEYLVRRFGKGNIPGQPRINGHPAGQWIYSSARLTVDDLENVQNVVKRLKKMGFQTENNKPLLDAARKDIRNTQMIFGGIGLIAMFVATIGISNTMFMAIMEREKTIGIMKVLGGRPKDILKTFLCESGAIGLFGGFGGGMVSVVISRLINEVAVHKLGYDTGISVLDVRLLVSAVFFSVFIGVVSGYFPARKAMRITVAEAVMRAR